MIKRILPYFNQAVNELYQQHVVDFHQCYEKRNNLYLVIKSIKSLNLEVRIEFYGEYENVDSSNSLKQILVILFASMPEILKGRIFCADVAYVGTSNTSNKKIFLP